MMKLTCAVS